MHRAAQDFWITASTHQEHGNANLQKDPDNNDDVAVYEDSNDHVERAVVGVHCDEAVELGEAGQKHQ